MRIHASYALLSAGLGLGLAMGLGACGDDVRPDPDAALQSNNRLEILTPPGESIGLGFSATSALRIRYVDADNQPIVGAEVQFTLLDSGNESTGGASLSAAKSATDALGIARVDLVAGAQRVDFRVQVSAPQAPSVLFYVQVSDQGFVDLALTSAHEGPRDPSSYQTIQLRLFSEASIGCGDLDFDDPPESLFSPRTQDAFGTTSEFKNLAADDDYTVIAWAEIDGGRPLAVGCLGLSSDKLRSGSTFAASLVIVDRPYEMTVPLGLQTEIDLQPLTSALPGAAQWNTLACPLGRAQLLLDCLVDAQDGDGLLDCQEDGSGPLALALESRRGVLGVDGCREASKGASGASIEATLAASLTGWPSATELDALLTGRGDATSSMTLRSELTATAQNLARHRLLQAQLGDFSADLIASDRPVVEATGVAMGLSAAPLVDVASHGFTLRYGQLAADAFESLALDPANVSGLGAALGSELISGAVIDPQSGCAALELFLCSELSLAANCADQCASIAAPLDTQLGAWLLALVSSGLDYEVAMQAEAADADNDLRIGGLSSDGPGIQVTLSTDTETLVVPATLSTP